MPVLFILSLKNYHQLNGFRLNLPEYSPFSHERMLLLCEALPVYVLKIEKLRFKVTENEEKEVNVVYLWNSKRFE